MTARRLALAWCWGATTGLLVGWVYGAHAQRMAEAHRLGRVRLPEPREAPRTGTSATEAAKAAQEGVQREGTLDVGDLHARPDYQEAMRRAETYPWEPVVDLVAYMADHDIPAQRACEPCPQYSPGGGIPCSVTGPHTARTSSSGPPPETAKRTPTRRSSDALHHATDRRTPVTGWTWYMVVANPAALALGAFVAYRWTRRGERR